MTAKKEVAYVFDTVQFPKIAQKWLESIGFTVLPWPIEGLEERYVFVVFKDREEAVFYSRRWNGRMGDDLLRQATLEAQG